MKSILAIGLLLLVPAIARSLPIVDGVVSPGEYDRSVSLIDGALTLHYFVDAGGGLYLAATAATSGWIGVGIGSQVMDGAHIFMGYVKDGTPVVSEQSGVGHTHRASESKIADSAAVAQRDGTTTIELHVPPDKVPLDGHGVDFIVAFSGAADLTTFHDDDHDSGTIEISP